MATYFPPQQTACDYHLTSNSAGHCPSRFHPVEAAPNSAIFRTFLHTSLTPHEFFLQKMGLCFTKAFALHIWNSYRKLGRHNTHTHSHSPAHAHRGSVLSAVAHRDSAAKNCRSYSQQRLDSLDEPLGKIVHNFLAVRFHVSIMIGAAFSV